MKVLLLVQKEQRAILDRLYDGIAAHCECDVRWLSSAEQRNLRGYFRRQAGLFEEKTVEVQLPELGSDNKNLQWHVHG